VVSDRITGRFELDELGYDRQLTGLLAPLARLRWTIDIDGADLLPKGGAIVVFSQRMAVSEPWVLQAGLGAIGHPFRHVGVSDRQPASAALSRLGWVPATPADIRAVLRVGQLAGVGLGRSVRRRFAAGPIDADLLQPALDLGRPVVPMAVVGRELGRRWQVIVGAPVTNPRRRRAVTAAELAERARERVDQLLEAARPRHLPF
jgi:hypothetical protein